MKYEIKTYTDKNKDLTQSDWDILKENLKDKSENETEKETTEIIKTEEMKAIVVKYSLPSSSYATMALREVLLE